MNFTELLVAWRYIRSKQKEKFISAIGIFSFIGVALGVATMIIVTSVMNGFRAEFASKIIGFNGHLSLYSKGVPFDLNDVVSKVEDIHGVNCAIPVIERHSLISNGSQIRGSIVMGISKKDLPKYSMIKSGIALGDIENFNDEDSIIIGDSLAQKFNAKIRGNIIILSPDINETSVGMFPRKKTLKMIATFKSGMHEYDSSVAIIPLSIAQKLFKISGAESILVFANDSYKIDEITNLLNKKLGNIFKISNWQKSNSAFMNAIKVEKNVMFIILTLITLVASFNVISCMIMLVKDKEKEIAILKTLGFSKLSIMRIFLFIGSAIGVLGTILGTACGLLFSLNIEHIRRWLEKLLHADLFSAEIYYLTQLPSIVDIKDVLIIVIFALFISFSATLYPSIKASKLNPAEILRYA